jgi:uncharacterized protein YdaU (DUF1376 family)
MTSRPFMQLYGRDWRDGTRGLSLAEKGLYIDVLTLLQEGEDLPADCTMLSRKLGVNPRTIRTHIPSLIAKGKLFERNGFIVNPRLEREAGRSVEVDFELNSERIQREFELNSAPIRREKSEKANEINGRKSPIPEPYPEPYERERCADASPDLDISETHIRGPGWTIDLKAVEMTAVLTGTAPDEARIVAEICARDWLSNGTRPQWPMAVVQKAITSRKYQSDIQIARMDRSRKPPAKPAGKALAMLRGAA